MIALNDSQYLKIKLGGAVTTNELSVTASWGELYQATDRERETPTSIGLLTNGSSYIDVVTGDPQFSRKIRYVSVKNRDTVKAKVYVSFFEDATEVVIGEWTLEVRDTLIYDEGNGWQVLSFNGSIKISGSGIGCADGTVENSDASYSDLVPSGGLLVLPDETLKVYNDGVLNFTGLYVPLSNEVINITL